VREQELTDYRENAAASFLRQVQKEAPWMQTLAVEIYCAKSPEGSLFAGLTILGWLNVTI
jgi:hypothetical protein